MTCCARSLLLLLAAGLALLAPLPGAALGGTVYRCPGPPILYTDALTPEDAKSRGCHTIEGAPVTVIQAVKPRAPAASNPNGAGSGARAGESRIEARIEPATQRQRDSDARRILDAELRREEDKLAALKRDYNNGEPERRGDERNFQNYLDRVALMKANISRSESDILSIKRELGKLPS